MTRDTQARMHMVECGMCGHGCKYMYIACLCIEEAQL